LDLLLTKNMINSPTYRSGSLKDLSSKTFVLKPKTNDHDFKEVPANYAIEGQGEVFNVSGNLQTDGTFKNTGIEIRRNNASTLSLHNAMVDDSMNALYFRFTCRSNLPGSSTSNGSNIMAHICANQEIVYDDDTREAMFMTHRESDKRQFEAVHDIQRQSSPVQIQMDMADAN